MPLATTSPEEEEPLFSAVTSSTRTLYSLLKCISFSPTAQIQVSNDGIRVTVEDSRIMQGHAFLEKKLFPIYTLRNPARNPSSEESESEDDEEINLSFTVSLPALLECLQMFSETSYKPFYSNPDSTPSSVAEVARSRAAAAAAAASGSGGGEGAGEGREEEGGGKPKNSFRMSYQSEGWPLVLTINDNNTTTICRLITFTPHITDDIPLSRVVQKIIMKASHLHDAVLELDASASDRLVLSSGTRYPFLTLGSKGAMGSATVEFSDDKALLETFQVEEDVRNEYNFRLFKHALRAMSIATKVSIRGDSLGVLSMQFMIEADGGMPNFIDFRFLPAEGHEDD
ncbi:checkpoint clamp complex protein Rad1 [Rhizina undulata]